MKKLIKFFKDEEGATAVEYGLMVAGIAIAIIVIVFLLGTQLNELFQLRTWICLGSNAIKQQLTFMDTASVIDAVSIRNIRRKYEKLIRFFEDEYMQNIFEYVFIVVKTVQQQWSMPSWHH